jgi:di/tricarboxylate transporter
MLFAQRWLGVRTPSGTGGAGRPSLLDWIEQYKLADREHRLRVTAGSPLVGKTLEALGVRSAAGAHVVAIERPRTRFARDVIAPSTKIELQAEDVVFVDLFASAFDIGELQRRFALEALPLSGAYFSDRSQELGMAEVMVSADSSLVGATVVEAQFQTRYRLLVIGLRHGRVIVERALQDERLRIGDTLLVIGPWQDIERLRSDTADLIILNLPAELDDVVPVAGRAPQALFCLVLMVGLMVSGVVANVLAALIACLLMGALRCIGLDAAYRSIHWKSLVLIVGMLPFSIALQKTGGVELAADGLMALTGGLGTYGVLGSVFAITSILGLFISNTATAVLMAPVALAIADELGASPYPFAMVVALAASTAFMTPISSPVNTLVVAPGNYSFGDFVRVGTPFAVVVLIVTVLLVPWLLPLYPR